ncbi:MAG: ATP-binding protein [Deltaproteobacteria bacterium]|nr:ATP-binding protein [Deltaproteobacteria bacterium]
MNNPIFRPIQAVLLGSIALVGLAIAVSIGLTWGEHQRLKEARTALQESLAFHEKHRLLEREFLAMAAGGRGSSPQQFAAQINELIELCPQGDEATRVRLVAFQSELVGMQSFDAAPILHTITVFREIAIKEDEYEAAILSSLEQEASQQIRYELAAPLLILAIGALAIPITRRRVVKPLEDFGRQMTGLAAGHYTPTPEVDVSTHTLPLHRSFIKLALRLEELEREHRDREATLVAEVRSATEALLQQQQSLARAERLAVAGELAASVAHEVRNPLAGIQMALENLSHELDDADLRERVDLVASEVVRLGRLVGEIVDAARHDPEPPSRFGVADLVDELLALTRYQLPPNVHVESHVEESLGARAPKERLRQALLNLVLNSAKALNQDTGRIEIDIASQGEDLRICVEDDGPGFPAEVIERGVRPFYSTRTRGTGLGLAMVRRFVREADGSMELSNRSPSGERRGARVVLLLPSAVEHG